MYYQQSGCSFLLIVLQVKPDNFALPCLPVNTCLHILHFLLMYRVFHESLDWQMKYVAGFYKKLLDFLGICDTLPKSCLILSGVNG